jgi:hypothetical protein
MANTVLVKRSAVANKVPQTTDLQLGEIAINTYDGKVYIKKNDGTDAIVQVGGGSSATTLSGLNDVTISAPSAGQVLEYDGTQWVNASPTALDPDVVVQSITTEISAVSGNTIINLNNNTPTSTTGALVWSQTITPTSSANKILVTGSFVADTSTNARYVSACLFRGTTCIGVTGVYVATHSFALPVYFTFIDLPATTSPTTYSMRVGVNSSSTTWYINQAANNYFNGLYGANAITLQEIS